ncbi:hypothetical protein [Pseudonocardia sp. NPDC049635]|uniref:hypothetical protein n=1 Tax=Pseudonocardia sp. NPDC049635 TaxID=3155506 RepID=UPI003406C53F
MTRRLRGRTCSTLGGVAFVAFLAGGCTDGVADGVEVCATDRPPHTRVDDRQCDQNRPGVGRFVQQLPATRYDDDGYAMYAPLVVPNVGQPLPVGAAPASGFVRSVPDPKNPGRVAGVGRVQRVPSVGAPAGSTISRGGLGVSGYAGGGSGS